MQEKYQSQHDYGSLPMMVLKKNNINFLEHYHIEVEFLLVLEGTLHMGINSQKMRMVAGDVAICYSNDIHYFETEGHCSVIVIKFLPDLIGGNGIWQKNWSFVNPFITKQKVDKPEGIPIEIYERIISIFHNLYREIHLTENYYDIFIKGMIIELCGIFLRYLEQGEYERKNEQSLSSIHIVQQALQYIEGNYYKDITLEEISREVNISAHYLSKLLNKKLGMNLKSYLNKLRINRAEMLIINESIPITDIAYQCGFNSLRTFNRWFKQTRGYTPTNLRKRNSSL